MRRRRNPSIWKRVFGYVAYLLLILLVLAASSVAGYIRSSPILTAAVRQALHQETPRDIFDRDSLTLLILGCDEDLSYGGKKVLRSHARSDMILVAKLDFKKKRISGVSIPRDTLAQVSGYRKQKINAFHAIGGADLSKRVVESLLGITVDRVMVINYTAFQEMVDMVGGVEVFVPKKMDWEDKAAKLFIHLKPGKQVLDGYNAMCFVRFRHSDSDFMRQERQKDFMLAFKDKVLSQPMLINQVCEKAMEVLGGTFSADELVTLALFSKTVKGDNIRMGMVPVVSAGHYNLEIDRNKLEQTLKQYYLIEPSPQASRSE